MGLLDYIQEQGVNTEGGTLPAMGEVVLAEGAKSEVWVNPTDSDCVLGEQMQRSLIVVHRNNDTVRLNFDLAQNSVLKVVQVILGGGFVECKVNQQADSRCEFTTIVLGDAIADYTVDLNGRNASNQLRGAFIAGGEERQRMGVRVNHMSADCQSDSLIKGIAGGKAFGEFNGMVYVAQDAQRTDARQTSRNIEIGREAHIVTKPQLEIYADDVKCSHGATVGQLDGDAILYMRQRGLSEAHAKRLQIDGFVRDIVLPLGSLGEVLAEVMTAKLELL